MAKGTRICRVCGKEYEYCHSVKVWDGINRWQDIACCPEHGAQYFAEVLGNSGAKADVEYQSLVGKADKNNSDAQPKTKKAQRTKKVDGMSTDSKSENN